MPVAYRLSSFALPVGLVYIAAQPAELPHRAKPYNAARLAKSHLLRDRFIFTSIASIPFLSAKGVHFPWTVTATQLERATRVTKTKTASIEMNRRAKKERRDSSDRRKEAAPVVVDRRKLERREKVNR